MKDIPLSLQIVCGYIFVSSLTIMLFSGRLLDPSVLHQLGMEEGAAVTQVGILLIVGPMLTLFFGYQMYLKRGWARYPFLVFQLLATVTSFYVSQSNLTGYIHIALLLFFAYCLFNKQAETYFSSSVGKAI